MASIGQLAAGVAHEINNPTAFVNSNLGTMSEYQKDLIRLLQAYEQTFSQLEGLRESIALPASVTAAMAQSQKLAEEIDLEFIKEDFSDLIEESLEGTERIKKIVADMKDFAHPGKKGCVETDINLGLDSTINIVWNEIKYKSKLEKDFGPLPPVFCHSQHINQVFMNMLLNAAQAIEKDGLIAIRTRHVDEEVVVQISDNGCGIPDNIQSQIYDPFFTTKEIGKGTGLGLSMSYNIIEKHKGRIEFDSHIGKGTTFRVYLPVSNGRQE
jgi:signal transduction histidine kinase